MQRRANVHCDGHKRDVLATFPLHLENQVDELLSHHSMKMTTARFVKAGAAESWIGLQDSQMDTFRGRLKKTQQADL